MGDDSSAAWVDEVVVPYLLGSQEAEPPRLFEVANGRVLDFIDDVQDRWLAPIYISDDPKNNRARLEELAELLRSFLVGVTQLQPRSIPSLLASILSPDRLQQPRDPQEALARELMSATAQGNQAVASILDDAAEGENYPGVAEWAMSYLSGIAQALVQVPEINVGTVLHANLAMVWAAWERFASVTELDRPQLIQMYLDGVIFKEWPY